MKNKNTKNSLKGVPSFSILKTLISSKIYSKNKKKFQWEQKKKINRIINNVLSKEEINFKDKNLLITNEEFMNRYYKKKESNIRLRNYIEFYEKLENYYQFNYEIYNQRKIMYKNQKRKYKLENRKIDKKAKKKNKRKNLLGKLKDSTIYLDEVKSIGSCCQKKKIWENASENFELNLVEYSKNGNIHDIYNPDFSSSQSFLSRNVIKKRKSCSDFFIGSLKNDNSSIDSFIAEISKLDGIEESQIRKKSIEPSQLDIGVFKLFPDLENNFDNFEKNKNFDFGNGKNFVNNFNFDNQRNFGFGNFGKNVVIEKAFDVKESKFGFHFEKKKKKLGKKIKNYERRRLTKKNSIKNNSDKNTLESKFMTDTKKITKIKKNDRKLQKNNSDLNFKKRILKKNTLENKKMEIIKKKVRQIKPKKLRARIFVNNFEKSNSKLSNKSSKNSSYKLVSKKSLKNNLRNNIKSKIRKNEYDYDFVEKKLFLLTKDEIRKKKKKVKHKNLITKKISFSDLSRNLSNKKLNSSLTKKKFYEKDSSRKNSNSQQKKKISNFRKEFLNNKKKKKSPLNSKLSNNRSRSFKREYDEYDYYKKKINLNDLKKKKNKSSDRKIIKRNYVVVKKGRISLQNLKGKEKDILKLLKKKDRKNSVF